MEIKYDFDEYGQLVIRGVTIDHGDFDEILREYQDGFCATNCGEEVNQGAIICDDCFAQAERYRVDGPPLPAPRGKQ